MQPIRASCLVCLLLVAAAPPLAATTATNTCHDDVYNCFILRARSYELETVARAHGLTPVEVVHPGEPVVMLVVGPAGAAPATTLAHVMADPLVLGFEMLRSAAVTEGATGAGVDTADPAFEAALASTGTYGGPEAPYFSTAVWNGYLTQPVAELIRVDEAHADPRPEALGLGIVAVIDTGVDPHHPLLQGSLVPGYDFLLERPGVPSEWGALDPALHANAQRDLSSVADQSYSTIVDGDGVAFVEQSYSTIVDQSYSTIVDQSYSTIVDALDLPPGFGHGTMVAGLVRLVAPRAMIMPLRVFDGYGRGDLAHIIRAVYWAVDNGADVINMSFSTTIDSPELEHAIDHARANGVVCVTSTGNEASPAPTFPAVYLDVLGIASTDQVDVISDFSNHGIPQTSLAATGEALITAFPGKLYASVWGTSFSSALVSGAVALLHKDLGDGTYERVGFATAEDALTRSAAELGDERLGAGRLDVDHAMNCGPTGGSCDG